MVCGEPSVFDIGYFEMMKEVCDMTLTAINYPDGAHCSVDLDIASVTKGKITVRWKTERMPVFAYAYFDSVVDATAFADGFDEDHLTRAPLLHPQWRRGTK